MKLEWVKEIPDYISYFNKDHKLIISLIGIDNYLALYEYFGKTGIYFCTTNNDCHRVIEMIGEEHFKKLYEAFGRAGIYFGSGSVIKLKKAWAIMKRDVAYNDAARILDVSIKSIYNWRQEKITDSKIFQN
jgi:hypothetical protein